ncbi:methyltransferase family protein [Mucilaginibacter frigoritolerans]|uniref:Methyltransferase family protein n=1 Tax=Mucilaginibacter frigoritolerans TaxID=652788 RepID=A0A562TWP2_9SPHI|nr:class I SAM-dependent methyltransferase [Mucilaginibacter frigoritolerans]TWI98029.1 methyltransferase family protein [Mucilaginibacter frigoritolerans]
MNDVLGQALFDYFHHQSKYKLWIHNQYGEKETMPIAAFFREEQDMPDIEWLALERCEGKVLDIGAGAGSHALLLQNNKLEVTAMDISPLAVAVMKARNVTSPIEADIFTYKGYKYDTLLLLMNGIGLAGNLERLKILLLHLKELMNDGGQLLFDSSDISYLYDGKPMSDDRYYGEINYQYEYKKQKTEWFKWLYIDEHKMKGVAESLGFKMEVLLEDEFGQYLARLTI